MKKVAFFLHFHMPYIKEPARPLGRPNYQEYWFYEAVLETYLPFIYMVDKLIEKYGPSRFRFNLNLSPTVMEMLANPYHRKGFREYVNRMESLNEYQKERVSTPENYFSTLKWIPSEKEEAVVRADFDLLRATSVSDGAKLVKMKEILERLDSEYEYGILGWFGNRLKLGVLDIVMQPGTHPLLPMAEEPVWVRLQMEAGIRTYEKYLKSEPKGVWLPESAYKHSLLEILKEYGLYYAILEPVALGGADYRKFPVITQEGFHYFIRNIGFTDKIWKQGSGYPAGQHYREFYKDGGWEIRADLIQPWLADNSLDFQGDNRHPLGLKYHRITGPSVPIEEKRFYRRVRALRQAKTDARSFQSEIRLSDQEFVTLAFDAELFGHWWRDGMEWLYFLYCQIIEDKEMQAVSMKEHVYMKKGAFPEIRPEFSSWGRNGYLEFWNQESNADIWRKIEDVNSEIMDIWKMLEAELKPETRVAFEQLLRETLLLQASDFPFIIGNLGAVNYSKARIDRHYQRAKLIIKQLKEHDLDTHWMKNVLGEDDVFSGLDLTDAFSKAVSKPGWYMNEY